MTDQPDLPDLPDQATPADQSSQPTPGDQLHHPDHLTAHEEIEEWRAAALDAEMLTGRHEETVEEAKRSLLRRIATVFAGSVVLALGLALLVLPGPGMFVTAAGLAILATEVPFAARWLERVRERLPEDEDGEVSKRFLVVSIAIAVVVLGVSVWLSWMKLTNEDFDIPLIPFF